MGTQKSEADHHLDDEQLSEHPQPTAGKEPPL